MEISFPGWIASIGIPLIYALGMYGALDAIMETRTAQGATAWALALITIPFVALPLYWVFGRAKFDDYIETLRRLDEGSTGRSLLARKDLLAEWVVDLEKEGNIRKRGELQAFHRLSTFNFTRGNDVELLINGKTTYDAIFSGLDAAKSFILVQSYIIQADTLGHLFKLKLIQAIERGVEVYLLYDEVGSHKLPRSYLREIEEAGGKVTGFRGQRSWLGRFRLNFRNHRKIIVVDGKLAFMGGLNVGEEYLGKNPKLRPWRDTHIVVKGPSVIGFQYSFVRDWFYSQKKIPDLPWNLEAKEADQQVLILASGPADSLDHCALLFTHAIESAEERVWIASPYFVPDDRIIGALQLAALRGVDVRIIMPRISDNILFKYVPYAFLPVVESAGVEIYLYEEGFMHQKVFLVDNDYAAVSTANFDYRSFLYNFEVTCLVHDTGFCKDVEEMLIQDFACSSRVNAHELNDRSFFFRLAVQTTRLLAPVL